MEVWDIFANLARVLSAWPMVARRSLANWRLLSSVVIGVVLASTIMAGTVIYFDSLRDLGAGIGAGRGTIRWIWILS